MEFDLWILFQPDNIPFQKNLYEPFANILSFDFLHLQGKHDRLFPGQNRAKRYRKNDK